MDVYENALYDDFTGFTFNGKHSSQFGLLRVSDGDRYEDTLVPSLSNESSDIPGGFGKHYWGEQINSREFPINIAYDGIGELDKRRIKQWLHPDDELHELIFDERPYVKYWVKCDKEVVASELCFNENGKRVYKGEMKIQFFAPMPYGVAVSKNLDDFERLENFDEWKDSSGLLSKKNDIPFVDIDKFEKIGNNYQALCHNGGDIEIGFVFECKLEPQRNEITYKNNSTSANTYILYEQNLQNDNNNPKLYIFINGNAQELEYKKESYPNVDADTMNGQFVVENEATKFESLTNGIIYDIFENGKGALYQGSLTGRLDSNMYVYGIIEGIDTAYEIYINSINGNTITFSFPKGAPENFSSMTILIPTMNDQKLSLTLSQLDKTLTLTLPGAATTLPTDWTNAQKALFYGGDIEIDTNKQIITWKKNDTSEKLGLVDIIDSSNGSLRSLGSMKIPSTWTIEKNDIGNIVLLTFSIESTSSNVSMLIDKPAIFYHYLYI